MLKTTFIKDWMTTPVITVKQETPISLAHKIMKDNGIRRLVVVDDHDKVEGIITIGDVREASPSDAVTLSIWELNYLWAQLTVSKIMTHKVVTLNPEDSMSKAASTMLDLKVSGIPVVDSHNQLLGIITESDIFRMVVKSMNEVEVN